MSKERELLKRFMTELKTEEDVVSLFNDIKECLAEPEQDQEPLLAETKIEWYGKGFRQSTRHWRWMMSKERELLKKVLATGWLDHTLSCEVEAILAQPEQEQDPVAWKVVDRTTGDFMFSRVKPMGRSYKYDVVIPLYTAPAARKHLTGIEISQGFKADDATHPIGGGE